MTRRADTPRKRRRWILALASLSAMILIGLALRLPLWQMSLVAPQYPRGLRLLAYGDRIEGDLREINIINHYVGMKKIDPVPAPEMRLFPLALYLLMTLCALAPLHRRLGQLAAGLILLVGIVILADLQWWLHDFGRNLDPGAPLRMKPFTPPVLGPATFGNFQTSSFVSYGFFCLLSAGLILLGGRRMAERLRAETDRSPLPNRALIVALGLLASGGTLEKGLGEMAASPEPESRVRNFTLQDRIDRAEPGTVLVVEGGVHQGPIKVRGPLVLRGEGQPVIDGGGDGSVVTVLGNGVHLEGFTVRNSGREVSEEAAGIKIEGSRHRIENNRIENVYFGIHLAQGSDNLIVGNTVVPDTARGERPGHGISLWYQQGSRLVGNRIARARDGLYLSFSDDLLVQDNEVTDSRYGLHSMFARKADIRGNRFSRNLLGAALMYSEQLRMECNRIEEHREGATAYGVLLKDIDDLILECNVILGNRVGIYADNAPSRPGNRALIRDNLLAGNDAALALQSNVALHFTGNSVVNNLTAVRTEGAHLSSGNRWSDAGRGNFWDDYRGYDLDADGRGDIPYRYEAVINDMVRKAPLARAFLYTPAHFALESGARLFPVFRPDPLIVDEHPLMRSPKIRCREKQP